MEARSKGKRSGCIRVSDTLGEISVFSQAVQSVTTACYARRTIPEMAAESRSHCAASCFNTRRPSRVMV